MDDVTLKLLLSLAMFATTALAGLAPIKVGFLLRLTRRLRQKLRTYFSPNFQTLMRKKDDSPVPNVTKS
jgi:hypothetical protein